MLSERSNLLTELEQGCLLEEPGRLRQRVEALDRLEVHFPQDRIVGSGDEAELHRRARAIRMRLDAMNRELYQDIRHEIQQGTGKARLLPWLPVYGRGEHGDDRERGDSYDYLDELVSGILRFDQPDDVVIEMAPEMVFYQPTPARVIFDLIERMELTERDVLVDLGSGLGHVALLAAICTDASCIGIELEAAYVDCARRCAGALNLAGVTFIQQDARAADFSSGTVFYLYTPFVGTILRDVLDALRRQAAVREIRVCGYGPCITTLAGEGWLQAVKPLETGRVALFRSLR